MNRLLNLGICAIGLLCMAGVSSAALFTYEASLSGPNEDPPVASPGTGFAEVIYDDVAHTLNVEVSFEDLLYEVTVAHIHAPTPVPLAQTAGVATTTPTFPGFPAGVTSGQYENLFDLTQAGSWNPAFVTANGGTPATAEAALAAFLAEGRAYLNIHTTVYAGGEIRGFLVPEPASMTVLGLGAVALLRRRRR